MAGAGGLLPRGAIREVLPEEGTLEQRPGEGWTVSSACGAFLAEVPAGKNLEVRGVQPPAMRPMRVYQSEK